MRSVKLSRLSCVAVLAAVAPAFAAAELRFTEFEYNTHNTVGSNKGSFVEITNVGDAAQDLTGYQVLEDKGAVSIASAGTIAPGESIVVTAVTGAQFRTYWNLPASVKVVGDTAFNTPSIFDYRLYSGAIDSNDPSANLVTHFQLGASGGPGRALDQNGNAVLSNAGKFISVNVPPAALDLGYDYAKVAGKDTYYTVQSAVADVYGSKASTNVLDIGNPGSYAVAVVPEPASVACVSLLAPVAMRRKRR